MPNRSLLECRRLPARLTPAQAGELLGCTDVEVRVLLKYGLLRPLGKPAQNGHKFLCAFEIEELSRNRNWLDQASRCIVKHWSARNHKQQFSNRNDEEAA